jgi:C-terminal processing protease CtpA/Prc
MRSRYYQFRIGTQTAVFYGVNVTDADFVTRDGARLEGAGVVPDEIVLPSPEDLAAQRDPVLARALTLAGRPINAADAGTLLLRRLKER